MNYEFENAFAPSKNLLNNSKKSSRSGDEKASEADPRSQPENLPEKGKKGKEGKEAWRGSFLGGLSEHSKENKPVRRRKKLNECDVSPHVKVSCEYGHEGSTSVKLCFIINSTMPTR